MHVVHDGKELTLPDFLLVGAEKSGTTSLFQHLGSHDQVVVPGEKEPYFLSSWQTESDRWVAGICRERGLLTPEDYSALFAACGNGQVTGEASVLYLYDHSRVKENISRLYGKRAKDLKVIAILRNPIDRAWSSYQMKLRDGREDLSFEDAIDPDTIAARLESGAPDFLDYTGFGRYAEQIKAWKKAFPDMHVIKYDDFCQDPQLVFDGVCDYLGLAHHGLSDPGRRYNASGRPRNRLSKLLSRFLFKPNAIKGVLKHLLPPATRYRLKITMADKLLESTAIPAVHRDHLTSLYRQDIEELSRILGWDLDEWI